MQHYASAMLVQCLGNGTEWQVLQKKEKQAEKRGNDETERQAEKMGNDETERQAEKMTKPIPRSLRYASQA